MNLEFITLGGYGIFVWPAFIFTFICCYFLYSKTRREFKKQEKIYLSEFTQNQLIKINVNKPKIAKKRIFA